MSINNIKERYATLKPLMETAPSGRMAMTMRQNRRAGSPTLFQQAAIKIQDLHELDLCKTLMPDGRQGLLCRLNNAKPPTEKFPSTWLFGGQGKNQAVTKRLDVEPTDNGRGSAFAWSDELLPVFLDLLEALSSKEPTELQLPRVMGSQSSTSLVEALQAVAAIPGEFNVFQTPCAGEVMYVTEPEHGQPGYVRVVQKQDENGLASEENIHRCDEIPILPGLRPIVKVGQLLELDEAVLEIDAKGLSSLTESQLTDLVTSVSLPVTLAGGKSLLEEPVKYVGATPLYATSNGKTPRGDVYLDIVDMVDATGTPTFQVFQAGSGIFTGDNLRIDLRPGAINWPRQHEFVPPTPRDKARAAARQRTRMLRELGEQGALSLLLNEAHAMPVKEYDLKLDHLSSGPFPLSDVLRAKVSTFSLLVRCGDEYARLTPAEKTVKINEFLEELFDENESSTGEAS